MAWWTILRPFRLPGRISMARTQRGSSRSIGVTRLSHASCDTAGIVNESDFTTRSGSLPSTFEKFQVCSVGHLMASGMCFGSPCGAPASTHFTMVSSSWFVSESSFLNLVMPTVRSIWNGGIECSSTRALMERAHGRDCCQVCSDIGAIDSGRWQASHFCWKIGATSLVKVGAVWAEAVEAPPSSAVRANAPAAPLIRIRMSRCIIALLSVT